MVRSLAGHKRDPMGPMGERKRLTYTISQNYWVFGLCPLSGILETRKHNVSETGPVSRITDDGPVILSVIHHRQNSLESTYTVSLIIKGLLVIR
jgi:hypothetical protein